MIIIGMTILSLTGAVCAQAAPPRKEFKAHAREVMVDMVVTKKNGQTIQNLRARQIRLWDNGRPQSIQSFRQVSRSVTLPIVRRPAHPGSRAVRLPKINLIALVFDSFGRYQRIMVQRGALAYIQKDLGPYDYAAIIAIYHHVFILQPFTNHHATLLAAVHKATSWKRSYQDFQNYVHAAASYQIITTRNAAGMQGPLDASNPSVDLNIGGAIASFDALNGQIMRENASWRQLPGLLQIIRGLGQARGRKVLIFFTQALAVDSNTSFMYRHIIRSANRHHVSIYLVDPNGPGGDQQTTQNYVAEDLAIAGSGMGSINQNIRYDSPLAVMRGMADDTGGHVIADTNDLAPGLTRVAHDIAFHYELTYVPTHPTPGAHHIRVLIPGHRNWRIDARKDYYIAAHPRRRLTP
jgi:VWFA-related protein